jgi:hypothetical protein
MTNIPDIILYMLAFVGAWHLIGIPPISTWFRKGDDDDSNGSV